MYVIALHQQLVENYETRKKNISCYQVPRKKCDLATPRCAHLTSAKVETVERATETDDVILRRKNVRLLI